MKTTNKIRSQVATLANSLFYSSTLTRSESWKKAWAVIKLKNALRENEAVEFTFTKKSTGEERRAVGTLVPALIAPTKGTGRPRPLHIVTYFDLERNAYRSFDAKFLKVA